MTNASPMNVAFPWQLDSRGRTAVATYDDHILQMIEQLLFTIPGERVNRPSLGSGLLQLVFAPNSPEVAAALQFAMKASLQNTLGDVISLQDLVVTSVDSTLSVLVQYSVLPSGNVQTATFSRTV
jgi:phage baseplate assembly protein W